MVLHLLNRSSHIADGCLENHRASCHRRIANKLRKKSGDHEDSGRDARAEFRVSDAEMVKGLGITRATAKAHREQLEALGLVTVLVQRIGKKTEIAVTKVKY